MIPRGLSIAGSDSGGGAGIQADLKTFSALGVFGMTAVTALTAQNTTGVAAIVEMTPAFVRQQIDAVIGDIGVDAAKTGMLSSAPIIEAVADALQSHRITALVVDPVMIAKGGAPLLRPEACDALRRVLLPLALVVTPNLYEAGALLNRPVRTLEEMEEVARELHALGPRYVVVKGGHLEGAAVDVVFDGERSERLAVPRIDTEHTHGTGCVFSAAITAGLARGLPAAVAIRNAKRFITRAIEEALAIGSGHGPANPMHSATPWPGVAPGA
ncbi:MAG TPA: bifunctional hydroxymethylpyrimidine kinase/phosphomethylpyrimidine kinase [bacterium]|nr:bifunctional hydroxymethylpyrimidine kinase/phosphomethylpyrimidine kinase [bacterium]